MRERNDRSGEIAKREYLKEKPSKRAGSKKSDIFQQEEKRGNPGGG